MKKMKRISQGIPMSEALSRLLEITKEKRK